MCNALVQTFKLRQPDLWRSRQKYDTAFLSMIYLSGEGESGALNVKGNFHRAPHRGAKKN
jgi:hypothetical protein